MEELVQAVDADKVVAVDVVDEAVAVLPFQQLPLNPTRLSRLVVAAEPRLLYPLDYMIKLVEVAAVSSS